MRASQDNVAGVKLPRFESVKVRLVQEFMQEGGMPLPLPAMQPRQQWLGWMPATKRCSTRFVLPCALPGTEGRRL